MAGLRGATIEEVVAQAWVVPTDEPEADGTLTWDSTTVVLVEVKAAGQTGLGWTYGHASAAHLVNDKLGDLVVGREAADVPAANLAMVRAVRNMGRRGIASTAISAVDIALWDLKARLLDVPLAVLLGKVRDSIPAYGSGGFTTWDDARLREEIGGWTEAGMRAVKIKIGEDAGANVARDLHRTALATRTAGPGIEVFVDANGGYSRGQAARMGAALDNLGVTWFEEPVTSDDLQGLHELRTRLQCDVSTGEYAWCPEDAQRLIEAGAVDCLQADVTRCEGVTGWLRVAALADAAALDVSTHCAPQLSAHVAVAVPNARHIEWFHDHVRLDPMLVEGTLDVVDGTVTPDLSRPGHGMRLRAKPAEPARRVA
ncbi:enolase C-terminal domain-like protein [Isoptericola sp. b441]|uniref:Enolase C-terminal domain-like protein n=1 Tax=Actinotalea lenta TaxID=3064654 RepID=A0ABT9D8J8_9CELL|nr:MULTISPECIES: enolase C-terminal domain-like protein [unclassified Isoptericola]MDO8107224.1 enolase C-terminal domain-like protein [Isoptericola sp. b441]MDO8121113.1 enolase C-terminal domain-like protein [Isoptericola sp. b490]